MITPKNTTSPSSSRSSCVIHSQSPQLTQIVRHHNSPLLTFIDTNNKHQLSVLDLNTLHYLDNYQSMYNAHPALTNTDSSTATNWASSSFLSSSMALIAIFSIFVCNSHIAVAATYSVVLLFLAMHISKRAHLFAEDLKCTIPDFEQLLNIRVCAVDEDGIYFVANQQGNSAEIKTFKFDLASRQYTKLKSLKVDMPENSNMLSPYQLIYAECIKTIILFTNSCNIFYMDLSDGEHAEWQLFEDIQLPRVPSNECHMNAALAFTGIIFLFYNQCTCDEDETAMKRRGSEESVPDSDSDEDGEANTYCWDLTISGELFQCDHNDSFYDRDCVVVNTESNWCHFMGVGNPWKTDPYHFKIDLRDQVPVSLSITHLQVYHSLIKQYVMECIQLKVATDIEMLILDYFPFYL